jgi:hypothetical protein
LTALDQARVRAVTPEKADFGGARQLSIVAEDDERDSASRARARSRGLQSGGGTAGDELEAWGNVVRAGEATLRGSGKFQHGGGGAADGSSYVAAARPSILDGLPPDPFDTAAKLPSGLVADLTSSDEDEADQPPRTLKGAGGGARPAGSHASGAGGKGRFKSKISDPEEEDEDGYTREQCEILGRPFYAARPGVGGKTWGRAEKSDSDSGDGSEASPLMNPAAGNGRRAQAPSKGAAGLRAQFDFSSGSESD